MPVNEPDFAFPADREARVIPVSELVSARNGRAHFDPGSFTELIKRPSDSLTLEAELAVIGNVLVLAARARSKVRTWRRHPIAHWRKHVDDPARDVVGVFAYEFDDHSFAGQTARNRGRHFAVARVDLAGRAELAEHELEPVASVDW
ncbi:MAG: hypothetical protein HYY34_07185, partial [Chloroflexi bacterium]|nr:hypothetical protein [Chloroflexota bacterium]